MSRKLYYLFIVITIYLFACNGDKAKQQPNPLPFKNKKEYKQTMILSHQKFLEKEKKEIQRYIDSLGLEFNSSGTGLRYHIIDQGKGEQINKGDIAIVKYKLSLINGKLLYETKEGESQEFLVDFDDVEQGLHEGIKALNIGGKAIYILPAHLAHGITGDQKNIPPQSTIVYNLELLGKK